MKQGKDNLDPKIHYLLLLLCSPLIAFALHFIIARVISPLKSERSPLLAAAFAVLIGYVVVVGLSWPVFLKHEPNESEKFWAALYGLLVYSGFAFSYFQLFGMSETARRIHILYDLNAHGPTPRGELRSRYQLSDMLSVRFGRLVEWKQLRVSGGRYILNSRFLYGVAKIMECWARVLGFDQGKSS